MKFLDFYETVINESQFGSLIKKLKLSAIEELVMEGTITEDSIQKFDALVDDKVVKEIDKYSYNSKYNTKNKMGTLMIAKTLIKALVEAQSSGEQINSIDELAEGISHRLERIKDLYGTFMEFMAKKDKVHEIIMNKVDMNEPSALDRRLMRLDGYLQNSKVMNIEFLEDVYDILMDGSLVSYFDKIMKYKRDPSKEGFKGIEYRVDGQRFVGYKISNPNEAKALCWSSDGKGRGRYCIASNEVDTWIDMYGGFPFYMIMEGEPGQEDIYAAYVPNMLGKKPEEAIRNKMNSGQLEKQKIDLIRPLLRQLDPRVDEFVEHSIIEGRNIYTIRSVVK